MLERLCAAFVASPGLAVSSEGPTHFEHLDRPIDGTQLIAAAAAALGHRVCVAPRAEASRLDVTELCQAKHWPRSTFYERTRAAADRVALYLNEHHVQAPESQSAV